MFNYHFSQTFLKDFGKHFLKGDYSLSFNLKYIIYQFRIIVDFSRDRGHYASIYTNPISVYSLS